MCIRDRFKSAQHARARPTSAANARCTSERRTANARNAISCAQGTTHSRSQKPGIQLIAHMRDHYA
eukprot:12872493-Alexandrium_andersonii.AAC.1